MFILVHVTRCAKRMTQLRRFKVNATVLGIGFTLEFRVCSISPLPQEGFSLKLCSNEHLIEMVYRTHEAAIYAQCQGHN